MIIEEGRRIDPRHRSTHATRSKTDLKRVLPFLPSTSTFTSTPRISSLLPSRTRSTTTRSTPIRKLGSSFHSKRSRVGLKVSLWSPSLSSRRKLFTVSLISLLTGYHDVLSLFFNRSRREQTRSSHLPRLLLSRFLLDASLTSRSLLPFPFSLLRSRTETRSP